MQKKTLKLNFNIFIFALFLFLFLSNGAEAKSNYGVYEIDATKNARYHSNMGNIYLDEKNYNAALKEYQIAYALSKDANISASYIYNIANLLIKLGDYKTAAEALDLAISRDCINLTYYKALVDCYKELGSLDIELKKYLSDNTNPYNRIVAGLIYLKKEQKLNAKVIFDEFIVDNPDMIITPDIKAIIEKL